MTVKAGVDARAVAHQGGAGAGTGTVAWLDAVMHGRSNSGVAGPVASDGGLGGASEPGLGVPVSDMTRVDIRAVSHQGGAFAGTGAAAIIADSVRPIESDTGALEAKASDGGLDGTAEPGLGVPVSDMTRVQESPGARSSEGGLGVSPVAGSPAV